MSWELALEDFTLYILVFCRLGGIIFFNPFLSRRNIPSMIRAGLTLTVTLVLAPTLVGTVDLSGMQTTGAFLLAMGKEMTIGMLCGMVIQFFYYMIFMAGDVMDTGFGLAMAKVFDPGTNIQMSVSGNLFQVCFILYFFITRCDLILLQIIFSSYSIFPVDGIFELARISGVMIDIFSLTFRLAIQLAAPFVAAGFILEVGMGVLMKLVPQVSIFMIHFQLKIILGILLLLAFASPITEFLQKYMDMMFQQINVILQALQ